MNTFSMYHIIGIPSKLPIIILPTVGNMRIGNVITSIYIQIADLTKVSYNSLGCSTESDYNTY